MKHKDLLRDLTGKRILLYGMSREGTSSLSFLQGFDDQVGALDILDEKLDKLPAVEGKVIGVTGTKGKKTPPAPAVGFSRHASSYRLPAARV